MACRILVPQPGIELAPAAVEVLTTRLPGKSLFLTFKYIKFLQGQSLRHEEP